MTSYSDFLIYLLRNFTKITYVVLVGDLGMMKPIHPLYIKVSLVMDLYLLIFLVLVLY